MDSPLHRRIRSDIAERILSGEWPPGFRIPFEHELMADYDCSRMTVSKALAPLAERGMIVRRKRFGSFVARPRIHSVLLDIPDIQAEIQKRGEPYGYELLMRKIRAAHRRDASELGLTAAGEVIELRCLHKGSGRAFALEERVICLTSVPQARDAAFDEIPPGTWLLERVPWTEAEHKISAVNVSRATAMTLGVEPSAACLSLERRTWRRAEGITFVRLTFPGEAYDLGARFAPSEPDPTPPTGA